MGPTLSIEATFSRSSFFTTYAMGKKSKPPRTKLKIWSSEQRDNLLFPSRSYLHILSPREHRESEERGYNAGLRGVTFRSSTCEVIDSSLSSHHECFIFGTEYSFPCLGKFQIVIRLPWPERAMCSGQLVVRRFTRFGV
jgi:hypothetical protein